MYKVCVAILTILSALLVLIGLMSCVVPLRLQSGPALPAFSAEFADGRLIVMDLRLGRADSEFHFVCPGLSVRRDSIPWLKPISLVPSETNAGSVANQQTSVMMTDVDFSGWLFLVLVVLLSAYPAFAGARRYKGFRRRQLDRCPQCGYNLSGNESGVCPECGTPTGAFIKP